MTKLLTYAICALTALSVTAAPVDFGDIAADYPLYDSSDPFAIGVSTAAYTSATNANARIDALMLSNATTITNISTYVTAQHANRTDNPHGVTAAQVGALTAEADTLATVTARGDFAGTETITPLSVNSKRFGNAAGEDASGTDWTAVGSSSGINASGDFWTSVGSSAGKNVIGNAWGSFGFEAGAFASGTSWTAIGNDAGYSANGDVWTAVGYFSGAGAQWWYSSAFGNYAGYHAVGTNQFFADNYLSSPPATAGYATNNMIFGDAGQLNLGRTGALTNALPNQLRGRWQGNGSEFTGMTVSQIAGAYPASNPSNFVTAAKFNFTNGTTMADGVLNGTNGIFFVPLNSTNRYWILGGN